MGGRGGTSVQPRPAAVEENLVQQAQDRQGRIAAARTVADYAAVAEETLIDAMESNDRTLTILRNRRHRGGPGIAELSPIADEVERMLAAGVPGRTVVDYLRREASKRGLTPIARSGTEVAGDRSLHGTAGGRGFANGDKVLVIRPGYRMNINGQQVVVAKALVER